MIVGTAGHIGHDKTTLVKALTGITAAIAAELAVADPAGAFNAAAFRDQPGNGRKVAIRVREFSTRLE